MPSKKHDKPIAKTTKGKDRNFLPTDQGAGMTAKGRANREKYCREWDPQESLERIIKEFPNAEENV